MSTIHLITPEYFPKVGGVAAYTHVLARGLTDAGEDVHVWCSADGAAEPGDRLSVHPELGQFRRADLARAGASLDRFPSPRRLIVQWVPHGYGQHSMNVSFCFWLWKRAQRGDRIEMMVHEPYLTFWEGSWRQTAAAVVHRMMAVMLLQASQRVWVSIPAWERMWKRYTMGRTIPFEWLPIPCSVPEPDLRAVGALRAMLRGPSPHLVGHLSTYSPIATPLLEGTLFEILTKKNPPRIALIGVGGDEFRQCLLRKHPEFESNIVATGPLNDLDLAAHIAACDLLIQPYPDGVTSRRTTVMAGLALGVPIVTTSGWLTEPLWADANAVRLVEVGDHAGMAAHVTALLESETARARLSEAGRDLYRRTFHLNRSVHALIGAGARRAA